MNARIDRELQKRVQRLSNGDFRIDDFVRIFLDLRGRCAGKSCFREIGDFVAHRDKRTKGLVTQEAKYLFSSLNVWSMRLRNLKPSIDDIFCAAKANLFLATDEQLKKMGGLRRDSARGRLKKVRRKWVSGRNFTNSEADFLGMIGNKFVWRPIFSDERLFEEFCKVLLQNNLATKEICENLQGSQVSITLFAISIMHGCQIQISDNMHVELLAGYREDENYLCVFINVIFDDLAKPLFMPICLFTTKLAPGDVCDAELIPTDGNVPGTWDCGIEIGHDWLLQRA